MSDLLLEELEKSKPGVTHELTTLYAMGGKKPTIEKQVYAEWFKKVAFSAMYRGYLKGLRRRYPWKDTITGQKQLEALKAIKQASVLSA